MSFIYPRAMFFVVIYLFVYCALTWNGGENTGTCQKKKYNENQKKKCNENVHKYLWSYMMVS